MMRGQPDFADEILAFFERRGAHNVEIPVIQPADPFLDMAGEDLRRRIFLTESETGQSLCLRPEFTIPVCLRHIAVNSGTPRRYAYLGQVFRQRRDGSNEFLQAGIEDLGDGNFAVADARAVADAAETLRMAVPQADLQIVLGDQTVFEAVVGALGLPAGWQTRLIRAFGDQKQLDLLLQALSAPTGSTIDGLDASIAGFARKGDEQSLCQYLEERMRHTGYLSQASRTPAEIASRLVAKTLLADAHLDAGALATLKSFLALHTPLGDAQRALREFATDAGLDLNQALDAFDARLSALEEHSIDLTTARYRAAFGRPLDYYTGLVFEISSNSAVLAGGGRFDRLLTLLGARSTIPAVGFSLWLDRIGAARGSAESRS